MLYQGHRHEVSTGATDSDWGGGGRIRSVKTTYPQIAIFFSDFAHFIVEMKENMKNLPNRNFYLKIVISGERPRNFAPGEAYPHPPAGNAHVLYVQILGQDTKRAPLGRGGGQIPPPAGFSR